MQKKLLFLFAFIIFAVAACTSDPNYTGYAQPVYIGPSIGLGTIIAVVISWSRNKSIL